MARASVAVLPICTVYLSLVTCGCHSSGAEEVPISHVQGAFNAEESARKPLGTHTELKAVPHINPDIHPRAFYDQYIKQNRPVILRGAAKRYWKAFTAWTDEGLRKAYSDIFLTVEMGKKENRSLPSGVERLPDFLDTYRLPNDNRYCVASVPKAMRKDLSLLPPLTCGGYDTRFKDVVMWFSSGGTKSVLHNDDLQNIGCLLSGRKRFVMYDPTVLPPESMFDAQGYCKVDVDAVDLTKYPQLGVASGFAADVEAGDCLYVPVHWLHQVRSWERNLAVNMWFRAPHTFEHSTCGVASLPAEGNTLPEELRERTQIALSEFQFPEAELLAQNGDFDGEAGGEAGTNTDATASHIDVHEFMDEMLENDIVQNTQEAEYLWFEVYHMPSQNSRMTETQLDAFDDEHLEAHIHRFRERKASSRVQPRDL